MTRTRPPPGGAVKEKGRDDGCCGIEFLKYVLFFFNFLFWVSNFFLSSVGIIYILFKNIILGIFFIIDTNLFMHSFHIPQCTIQNRNVHISVLNGALWDMGPVHYEIYEEGLLISKTNFHKTELSTFTILAYNVLHLDPFYDLPLWSIYCMISAEYGNVRFPTSDLEVPKLVKSQKVWENSVNSSNNNLLLSCRVTDQWLLYHNKNNGYSIHLIPPNISSVRWWHEM